MQNFSPLKTANWQSAQSQPYSTAKAQIATLQERVGKLHLDGQTTFRSERTTQEGKLKVLDDKIRQSKAQEETRLKVIQDNIAQLQEGLHQEKVARELLEERKNKEVKLIEQQLQLQVHQEKQRVKQKCFELQGLIDERGSAMRQDMARERKAREEEDEQTFHEVADELESIRGQLHQEKADKEFLIQDIITKMGDQIVNIQEAITVQKKTREDSQNNIVRMLDELDFMLSQELANEKKAREENEEVFLKLLEDTCQKIEMGLKY